jgi:ATP-dependent DNA helicase PIF1
MLNEMRSGRLSEETCRTFKELERIPQYPDDKIVATELFALRSQVEKANNKHLAQLPGDPILYEAQDDGPLKKFMDKVCTAPVKLYLKENAQVMLIRNLTPTLVNGSVGVVVGFQDDVYLDEASHQWVATRFPVVRFKDEPSDIVMTPQEWSIEMPNGDVIASRVQVPLILSWAMSMSFFFSFIYFLIFFYFH